MYLLMKCDADGVLGAVIGASKGENVAVKQAKKLAEKILEERKVSGITKGSIVTNKLDGGEIHVFYKSDKGEISDCWVVTPTLDLFEQDVE